VSVCVSLAMYSCAWKKLLKWIDGSLSLSLFPSLSLQGAGQDKLGIYIKSVVKGGAADMVTDTETRVMTDTYEEEHKQWLILWCVCVCVCVCTGRSIGCRWPAVKCGRAQSGWPITREVKTVLRIFFDGLSSHEWCHDANMSSGADFHLTD